MLNRVTISGRLTALPEYRLVVNETPVATMRVAVERDYKNRASGERQTDFFRVTAWRGLADFAANYLTKGVKIEVDGRLEQSVWKDKDGNTRQGISIVAEHIYFAGAKKASAEQQESSPEECGEGDLQEPPEDPEGSPGEGNEGDLQEPLENREGTEGEA